MGTFEDSEASGYILILGGEYTLTVFNTGERSNWSDKKKTIYGSTGN